MSNGYGSAMAMAALALLAQSQTACAQESADALAKKLANPVASLISVPMQYNVDFDIGSENATKHYLNVQPVIPYSLSDHMNLITRVIVPVIYQDDVFGNSSDQFGLGDTTPSFFFSPKEPVNGWILGAGPTVLALQQTPTGWTYGALVNHIWSFAGDDDRNEISSTFIQPFLAKQFGGGRTITLNSESSYDWIVESWNAPVNLMYSKVTKWGSQLVSYQGGVRYFIETPGDGPEWGLRFALILLFPGG